ncbi:MAG: hypothetical protein GQ564_13035 [Bacteroidales bacterium]|jgi:acetone carboxylase gamma subunit|nr:hypothetical protein [Bacteroidales bacterium]
MATRYKKEELEQIVFLQLDNLNTQAKHIELLKKNNERLHEYNKILLDKITHEDKKPKPYSTPPRKRKK